MAAERMGEITGGNGNERRKEEKRRGMIQLGEERRDRKKEREYSPTDCLEYHAHANNNVNN